MEGGFKSDADAAANNAKTKHQNATKESNTNMSKVQREMDHLTALHNKYKVQLRDMELDNDDLEKSER